MLLPSRINRDYNKLLISVDQVLLTDEFRLGSLASNRFIRKKKLFLGILQLEIRKYRPTVELLFKVTIRNKLTKNYSVVASLQDGPLGFSSPHWISLICVYLRDYYRKTTCNFQVWLLPCPSSWITSSREASHNIMRKLKHLDTWMRTYGSRSSSPSQAFWWLQPWPTS